MKKFNFGIQGILMDVEGNQTIVQKGLKPIAAATYEAARAVALDVAQTESREMQAEGIMFFFRIVRYD